MNTPRINPDDPRWTAYVLGELDDAERAEIERLIESSEEARALVEELSMATMVLKDELLPLAPLTMNPEQRAAIRTAAQPAQPARRWLEMFPAKWGVGLAAAALLLLAIWAGQAPSPAPSVLEDAAPLPQVAVESAQARDSAELAAAVSTNSVAVGRTAEAESSPVAAPGVGVNTESSLTATSVEEVVGRGRPQDLPIAKDEVDLVRIMPGFQIDPVGEQFSVRAGLPVNTINTTRDGVSVTDTRSSNGISSNTTINPNLAGEIRVITAPVEAELGRSAQAAAPSAAPAARGGVGGPGRGGAASGGQAQGQLGQRLAEQLAAPPPPPPPAAPVRIDNLFAPGPDTEAYDRIVDNPFIRATQENFATFSIDVDTASYANVRRFLTQNQLPPRDAVRIEEMINYFSYDYAQPTGNAPIAPNMEVAAAPWNPQTRLLRIGIKAREINANRRPPSNLVFLIDVSGSMNSPVKLPLVKSGLKMLVDRLGENDSVSIVVYAGASGLVLPPTSAIRKEVIQQAIDRLQPGGSTNGASGIQLAYAQAVANFIRGGVNRVILMTDGDFNVGITNQGDLTRLIEDRAKSGVFLSVLGFGMGNIKDSTLERLADQGNGHYSYIDTINEARKVLVEEMGSTLVTVAKDVKIQVDFNPGKVEAYRLIGYENRVLRTEDFNNDLKDAGDMGAGHTVTALFEVVPKGVAIPGPSIDPSKYTPQAAGSSNSSSNEMLTLRVRYKQPDSDISSRMDVPLVDRGNGFARASQDFRFAASVAGFGMILRDSPYRGSATFESVLDTAEGSRGQDRNGYRQEFIALVQKARSLRR